MDKMLSKFESWIGKDNVQQDGNLILLTYDKCFCRLAEDMPRLPETYCYCSRGWLKEMFETVTGQPVLVDLHESIKSGGEKCRFTVYV